MCDNAPGYYLRDSERCAFGLGWEHRRRGEDRSNPFEGTWKEEHYNDGYEQFGHRRKSGEHEMSGPEEE